MPSKSPAQAKMMAAVAHSPTFAKKVGIPQSVGKDFNDADMRRRQGQLAGALRGSALQRRVGTLT